MDTTNKNVIDVSIKDLLSAGAHFGHQTRRWNPKMKRFVFEKRGGLYVIDLAKTLYKIRSSYPLIKKVLESRKTILFVGTKKQAKSVIKDSAEECGEFYVCERWLGGMLTNMTTIRQSIKTLEKIEKTLEKQQDDLTKKERSLLLKRQQKLDKHLSGIRSMRSLPGLLIVVDPSYERISIAEASKLGIPVLSLVDTNCDPTPISHVIPCNDDSLKGIKIIISALTTMITQLKRELKIDIIAPNSTETVVRNISQDNWEQMKYAETEEATS